MSKPESKAYGSRLKEITEVLHKHGITRGVTPEKLRLILEDLGPTFIKLGRSCPCIRTFCQNVTVMN